VQPAAAPTAPSAATARPDRSTVRRSGTLTAEITSRRKGAADSGRGAGHGQHATRYAWPRGHPAMLLMEEERDADMPLMDPDGLIDGEAPLPLAEGVGMFMFIGAPPMPML